jgi:hypothetical protein
VTWIAELLESTKDSESPKDYYFWAGLSAISAVVANNVYLDRFYYKLWPNIYVILVGRSGLRKGPPVQLAKALVEEVDNTRVFAGRSSIEAIISELATASSSKNGKPPIMDSRGFLVSSEFASFIIQNESALTILTDLYDRNYHDKAWDYLTKGGGKKTLKEPYLTMIGASNETHFKEAVPQNALGGGFVARTFIIHADKKSGSNSLTERPESIISVPNMAAYLKELTKVKGEFAWTPSAKKLYNEWYADFDNSEHDDDTGTLERFTDSVLKVATLLSLSRDPGLNLTVVDITEAIEVCSAFVPGARKVTLGAQGRSASKEGIAVVLRHLLAVEGHRDTASNLLRKFWGHFNSDEMSVIIESLVQARAIRIETEQVPTGRGVGTTETHLILSDAVLQRYNKMEKL